MTDDDPQRALTMGEIEAAYRRRIVPVLHRYPDEYPLDIRRTVQVSGYGDLVDTVETVASNLRGSRSWTYYWHVPKATAGTELVALDVTSDEHIEAVHQWTEGDPELFCIEVVVSKSADHDSSSITLTMYTKGMAVQRPRPLWSRAFIEQWDFPFAFVPARSVSRYELRVMLPRSGQFETDSGLGAFALMHIGDRRMLVASAGPDEISALGGRVKVRHRRSNFDITFPGTVAVCATAAVATLQEWQPAYLAPGGALIALVSLAGLLLGYRLT